MLPVLVVPAPRPRRHFGAAAGGRGRDGHRWPPPAQIPACGATAPGSYLGWVTRNRLLRPRVQDARKGQIALGEHPHPAPRQPTPLAPAPEGAVPAFDRVVREARDRRGANRHGVVGEPAAQDLAEPAALRLDPVVAGRPEPLLDLAQLRPHPLADRRPPQHEAAAAPPGRAVVREPEEGEGLRLAEAPGPAARDGVPSELDQPRLAGVEVEPKAGEAAGEV